MTTTRQTFIHIVLRLPGCLLAGVLSMLAFTLSPDGYVGISDLPIRAGSALWCVYAVLIAGLYWLFTGKRRARLSPGIGLMGLLFGVINYFATMLFAYDTWAFLNSAQAVSVAGLCILGQSAAMAAGISLVCDLLERGKQTASVQSGHGAKDVESVDAQPAEKSELAIGDNATQTDRGSVTIFEKAIPAPEADAAIGHIHDTLTQRVHTELPQAGQPAHPEQLQAGQPAHPGQLQAGQPAHPEQLQAGQLAHPELPQAGQSTSHLFSKANRLDRLTARFPRFAACIRRHRILSAMAFLLLCWSPFLIVFYPGTIIWDMGEMLGMLFGLREMTTWHPVFTTWIFGGCVWLGRQLDSDNLGAFLFTLLQTLAIAYALADSLRLLRRLGVHRYWRLAALLFFGLTPIFGSFAQAVGKDTLYTAVLLLFAVRTAEILRFGAPKAKGLLLYALWALLTCLVRTNGLYVMAGTSVLVVIFGVRGKARMTVGGALAVALALAFGFTNALLPALRIKDETASGLYSVCFQQSARVLRDHADTVTPEEYTEIDRVLDAAKLPALYEANISDPVKYTFRQYGEGRAAEQAALSRYRATWLAMLAKYPLTYLEAFIGGNSGYYAFTPKIDASRTFNFQGGIRFVFETYDLGSDPLYLHTTQIASLAKARELLAAYARGWRRVPVLELALFCPLYTWLLIAAGLSLARRKRWRELVAFAPALLSFGVCLLSPVNDYFRYFLPIVAMAPMLLGLAGRPNTLRA